jgi:hypothetical protein
LKVPLKILNNRAALVEKRKTGEFLAAKIVSSGERSTNMSISAV